MELVWSGTPPEMCDMCHEPIGAAFIDGRTVTGQWGKMCPGCHRSHGYGLGTGFGQRYEKQPDGRWLKTEG